MAKQLVPRVALAALALAVLIWVVWFAPWRFGFNQSEYQAVFLTNGQVYFGKLAERGRSVVLTDVYYLKAQQALQQPAEGEEAKTDLTLVQLGQEIHGPVNEMRLNPEQVLFVEDLRDDGAVVKAILEYRQQ